jgi:hypothetical protein
VQVVFKPALKVQWPTSQNEKVIWITLKMVSEVLFPRSRGVDMPNTSLLTNPPILYPRSAVLSQPCPVPQDRGLYAWFFKEVPPSVPIDGCVAKDGITLLYVGISPKNETSTQNLRKRITTHFRGNAEGSTLRLTLGTLLSGQSDFPLRRVGSGTRMTFTHLGEQWLDDWMGENAFVAWVKHQAPWEIESEIFRGVSLPLNIRDNDHHPFAKKLSAMRSEAKKFAREMPIASQAGNM